MNAVTQDLIHIPDEPIPSVAESSAIMAVIERAATNPDIDVEKMERLLAMQERILDRNAETAFNEAMRTAQQEMPRIRRNKENRQTESFYADLEQISNAAVPVYTKHGFSLSYGTDAAPISEEIRITCKVSHIGGHSRDYHVDLPRDIAGIKGNQNKTSIHGAGSTFSYGRRYLILLIFNLTLTNEDTDGNRSGDCITEEQAADVEALITEVGADRSRFLAFMKAESVGQIPAKSYKRAVAALQAKRNR